MVSITTGLGMEHRRPSVKCGRGQDYKSNMKDLYTGVCVWKSEDNLQEVFLCLQHVGPAD